MAKRGRPPQGEQMDLIEVGPENQGEILEWAEKHRDAAKKRMTWGKKEVEAKKKVLALIKNANLTKLEEGKIKVRCGRFTVQVTPRDELVQIVDTEDNAGDKKSMAKTVEETEGEVA